ncbi:adenylyltransferase/sulfurtransferase [Sediminihabitans luteus]|uniref:Adenylyltransferase/sulfurtransferase n=1 Tax=Sediminihabitans luteus TaxID=1138585 RepID=A0A2M9CZC7_9CELL|nr:ThiF family adenylyltransferase [Sediminihabitans luteus]PJJ77185.1 adenylyltransferase/sulfurtransferase [Sediminihabitans luteus]GII98633.1 adenylyltransferase/sulfurtransferase MoeZ [Sediminihabitans luteus]
MTGTPRLAPLVDPGPPLGPDELARYARHLVLPGVGPDGQRRLAAARVAVIGAGGLGSPALLYLAAAGVGTIGIVDDDRVDTSNLQRQVIHRGQDVRRPKVDSARDAIAAVNPFVTVERHRLRLDAATALDVLRGYDLVLDGADNFATRYLVSDAAEVLGIPVVWGSIHQFQGQVSTFWAAPHLAPDTDPQGADAATAAPLDPALAAGVTYRDVFPEPPPPGAVPDCATGGVLGAMCGTIGSAMATEAIKLVTGTGRTLLGRLTVYDALDVTWRELAVRRDPTREPVTALLDGPDAYAAFCGLPGAVAASASTASAVGEPTVGGPAAGGDATVDRATADRTTVRPADLDALVDAGALLLDVREEWETQIVAVPGARVVPSGTFLGTSAAAMAALADLPLDRPVLVLCKSGARSARVVSAAREAGVDAHDVEGGVLAWVRDVAPHLPTY